MGAKFVFMDNKAHPHCANIENECLQSENIPRMDWPAFSPDLNLVEHAWDMLDRQVATLQPPPTCLPQLWRALLDDWVNFHAGQGLVLSLIRQQIWIPHGKSAVKKELCNCIDCFKLVAKPVSQMMGDLPIERINPCRTFEKVGIDFAGPITTKCQYTRKVNNFKSYICLFICMCTKAVRLELVSSLSAAAFLSALSRFVSRRGYPSDIYSVNGTNFVGASAYLKDLFQLLHNSNVQYYSSSKNLQWHFIPPYAPNFRGVWEASIKLTKHHLLKTLNAAVLNFKELATILCQIEACMNSRPLYPLSSDTKNLQFGLAIHQNDHQARRRFVEWAQNEIAVVPDFHKRILFSDEAHFWLAGYVNKQNCRIWSEANPQVYVETPLHPEKLTVWCALWSGGIIGPYFFKNDEGHNVTVNGDRYRAIITNFFIPELNNHDIQELWFQQDGATCHTACATIDLLKYTFGDLLISRFGPVNWPVRSCDLTPLDYFLWGYVNSLVYADKPQTLDHLEDNIRRVIADIRPQMLEKVIENWTSRLDYI
ncbi:integrase catalytic domain-containing protein [Trichonephila clavipes]|nr:integrase catalytic domain-containing protein [Trichonephila clavipes]